MHQHSQYDLAHIQHPGRAGVRAGVWIHTTVYVLCESPSPKSMHAENQS